MRAQTFDGTVEYLFMDGGSEDRTRELIEEMAAATRGSGCSTTPGGRPRRD
jgi:hypothetical protein